MNMRLIALLLTGAGVLSGCTAEYEPAPNNPQQTSQIVAQMTEAQKAFFVSAVNNTPTSKLEIELPKKLVPLGLFAPSFNIYEVASTAYALVLAQPADMSRWRAVAKLDSFDTGEFAGNYQAARIEALRRNPSLFSNCPSFPQWSAQYRQDLRTGS